MSEKFQVLEKYWKHSQLNYNEFWANHYLIANLQMGDFWQTLPHTLSLPHSSTIPEPHVSEGFPAAPSKVSGAAVAG